MIDQGEAPAGLLSDAEAATLATLRVVKRRRDWLVGRWTAKRLLQQALAQQGQTLSLQEIVIDNDADGAPFAACQCANQLQRLRWALSISHSHGLALCAVHPLALEGTRYAIGADIEYIEPRAANFVQDYFTATEMNLTAQASKSAQPAVVTAIWSAKEAVLKALHTGLRLDTRTIQCMIPRQLPTSDEWRTFAITVPAQLTPGARWSGWWRRPVQQPDFILTLAIKTETIG